MCGVGWAVRGRGGATKGLKDGRKRDDGGRGRRSVTVWRWWSEEREWGERVRREREWKKGCVCVHAIVVDDDRVFRRHAPLHLPLHRIPAPPHPCPTTSLPSPRTTTGGRRRWRRRRRRRSPRPRGGWWYRERRCSPPPKSHTALGVCDGMTFGTRPRVLVLLSSPSIRP